MTIAAIREGSRARDPDEARSRKRWALGLLLLVFAVTWLKPVWPREQALHSVGTVIAIAWLWWHDRRWSTRTRDFALVCGFVAVHCIAARWLYSNVPYDDWFRTVLHWSPQEAFGWQRNHADRFIHLMYGVSFTPLLAHHATQRWPRLSAAQAFCLAVMAIMCTSLVYEWIEWAIALTMSPAEAESYNGQQGDMWDAHTDMLLATLGALATWPLVCPVREPASMMAEAS
jgi:putative membrane protein